MTGRKSGRSITLPVWFVLGGKTLYLLPVQGSETQWFKNVLRDPRIGIAARDKKAKFRAAPVRTAKTVSSVVEKFGEKYGAGNVRKYYSKFDVAVAVKLSS